MKKTLFLGLLAAAALAGCHNGDNQDKNTRPTSTTEDEVILHAWSWNLNTIAENMKDIADAGYTYVQTSPVQTCFVGEDGGLALFGEPGDSVRGKWYYYYQPTDWQIGNYIMGTRDDFRNMADSARKYNVKVIVDVLPNHTAVDRTAVLPNLNNAVGGHENLYHANGLTDIIDYSDRDQCTTGMMGGLPDVNTENPDFQYYYLQYVNDLINLGARGFRYDTAKHIGVHSDPLDPKAKRNNFWDVATGRESVEGLTLLMPDSLFIYGEILQDKNVPEKEYEQYMDMTASTYGHLLRDALRQGALPDSLITSWYHEADPSHLVTWVESHDTYCNDHESADMTDEQMRMGFVFLTSRQHGRPLFYSRPAGSTRDNYWGNNVLGVRGNDEFKHPEIVAANKFRTAMSGQTEKVTTADNGSVIEVCRGNKGAAIINISDADRQVKMPTSLPDGDYTDGVHGNSFKVVKGQLEGAVAPLTSYILYAK